MTEVHKTGRVSMEEKEGTMGPLGVQLAMQSGRLGVQATPSNVYMYSKTKGGRHEKGGIGLREGRSKQLEHSHFLQLLPQMKPKTALSSG